MRWCFIPLCLQTRGTRNSRRQFIVLSMKDEPEGAKLVRAEMRRRSGTSTLQAGAIPLCEARANIVGAVQELVQGLIGRFRGAHVVVHQNEFGKLRVPTRRGRSYGLVLHAVGLRDGVGIKCRAIHRSATRPETGAAYFVRVGRTADCALALRHGDAAGKTRAGEVKTPPEEVHRAAFSLKLRAESFEYFGGGDQD